MESFIVRIYRRGKARAEPAGTVEHVGTRSRVGFAGRDELLQRLLDNDARSAPQVPAAKTKPSQKRR